jgi:hypothetical protein
VTEPDIINPDGAASGSQNEPIAQPEQPDIFMWGNTPLPT